MIPIINIIIIGIVTLFLLNRGEGAFHVAMFEDSNAVEEHLDDDNGGWFLD